MHRMTIVSSEPLIKDEDGLATFLIPPYSAGFNNKHPIRVYQQTDTTQAASSGYYLILVSMLHDFSEGPRDPFAPSVPSFHFSPFLYFLKHFYGFEQPAPGHDKEESKTADDSSSLLLAVAYTQILK